MKKPMRVMKFLSFLFFSLIIAINLLKYLHIVGFEYLYHNKLPLLLEKISIRNMDAPTISFEMKGNISIFIWLNLCSSSVNVLKGLAGFPNIPDFVEFSDTLKFSRKLTNFGQRVFGYILPDITGNYSFAIDNYLNGGSELWLSYSHDPKNVRLIAQTFAESKLPPKQKYSINNGYFSNFHSSISFNVSTISKLVLLHVGESYYFEVFIAVNLKIDAFSILWKPPDNLEYSIISSKNIAQFNVFENQKLLLQLPSFETSIPINELEDTRNEIPFLKKLDHNVYSRAFPYCRYRPSYIKQTSIDRYTGFKQVFEIQVFILNNTDAGQIINQGAPTVWAHEAIGIVNIFLLTIQDLLGRIFENFSILNIEKTHDNLKGDRYLIEGKVRLVEYPDDQFVLSQYVYKFKTATDILCIPNNLPDYTAFIHFLIIVKDQSRWVRYLVINIEKIFQITGDNQFGLTIVDFSSMDMNISEFMQSTLSIQKFSYVSLPGEFNKVLGQNTAIQMINDNNDIIFTCDLHLFIPVNIVDLIRKHTIQGVSAFAPILRRLDCGITLSNEEGKWEKYGFGLFSMFKSDWVVVGGMNNKDFGLDWGGEDWELVDRVLGKGYEINRLRIPRLVHFYHSREGNWYKNYGKEHQDIEHQAIEHQDTLMKDLFNFKNLFDYLKTFW